MAEKPKKKAYSGSGAGPSVKEGLELDDAPEIERDEDSAASLEKTVKVASASTPTVPPIKRIVSMPSMPDGAKAVPKMKDGSQLPTWVKFDALTGEIGGTPPAGFQGQLDLVIQVPQANGSMVSVPVSLGNE